MEQIQAKKPIYKIDKILGSGLTSQVYKAFREDDKGWSRQNVALKIIHSENQVQVLKREFDSLLNINSKHCVKMLAWENLQRGPALVLEYIEGVTLAQLLKSTTLSRELIEEIMSQCQLGLETLHAEGVFHGDLNLKNIMVDSSGIVKLIDFGFQGADDQYLTPQFSSPERLRGESPTTRSDFYSWESIYRYLLDYSFPNEEAFFPTSVSRATRRRALAENVKKAMTQKKMETLCFSTNQTQSKKWKSAAVSVLVFLSVLAQPILSQSRPQYFPLELRAARWIELKINDLPGEYAPIEKKWLRPGSYNIVIKNSEGTFNKTMVFPQSWEAWKEKNKNLF